MVIATAKQGMSQNNFREAGYWLDKTVDQLLSEAIVRTPDKISIIAGPTGSRPFA
jgi:cyclohexanecarboxylate-CoA ligase